MSFFPPAARARRILRLGLPIMGGMSTYTLLELVDIVFVGFFGTVALAAVGISVFLTFAYLALFGGVSIAVQASTARLVGEGTRDDLARFLRTTLLLVVALAPLGALLLGWRAGDLLALISDDPAVRETGTTYLRWSFAAGVFLTVNNAYMGFWNATDRPHLYFRVVLVQAAVKLPLNYLLMFGWGPLPAFGVAGAGMATFAAALVGTIYHAATANREAGGYWRGPIRTQLGVVFRLMLPAGTQQFLENLALTLMFRIVAMVGTVEVAGYTVLVNLIGAVGLPAWGLGLAGATLVGQAMGAGDPAAANRWAWDVVKVGTLAMVVLGIPFWAAPEFILGLFIHDPAAIEIATWPCRILGIMIGINGIGYLFASLLYGAGDVARVMYVNLATQYLVLLPGAWLVGVHLGYGLIGVWLVHQFAFRALNAGILTVLWQQRRWAKVKLW
ncbi:MAG: MATE family efflux transporter [Pseudomonadales bacterium]|nr:MATE family efflux transporter [Pseudomonadales bacterium]